MAAYTFSALLCSDATGVTGILVGDSRSAAARAQTSQEVLRQLRETLEWRAEHEPWSIEPELSEPRLLEVKVEVRAQYKDHSGHRLIPAPELLTLRVPCLAGIAQNGVAVCEVPTM